MLKTDGRARELTVRRVAIAMYEGEINMGHPRARGGRRVAEIYPDHIDITLADHGPGNRGYIPCDAGGGIPRRRRTSAASGSARGMGLPNMKKYSDDMQIESTVGVGTTVTLRVNFEE